MDWIWIGVACVALVIFLVSFALLSARRFVRCIFRPILTLLYRREVIGGENLPDRGAVLVVCNHMSWIDGILLLWLLPRNIRFIVDGANFDMGFARWLAGAFDTILMFPGPKPIARALRAAREALIQGDCVGLFPEGTISRTGQLQGFRGGMEKVLRGTGAPVVPMFLHGMWGSLFSFSGGRFFLKWPSLPRRKLTLYVGRPLPADTPAFATRAAVAELGARAMIDHRGDSMILSRRLIRSLKRSGGRRKIADSTGVEMTGRELLLRTLIARRILRRKHLSADEERVGVLLPPSAGGVVANMALALDRRVAVNLNYTASNEVLNQCLEVAGIRTVLTSRRFLSRTEFKLDANVVVLEDFKSEVTTADKVAAAAGAAMPAALLERLLKLHQVRADDPLTVIFTSGSTGMPKGVVLSYANIGHNVDAIGQVVRLNSDDNVLGILPFFHSFGFSVTLWGVLTLPTVGVYHFNPLEAKVVGSLAEKYRATVLLATPTFLRGYMRRVTPEQFATLDVVVVGAEKMPIALAEDFEKRFGVRPVEGYGMTEMSPLVAVNVPPTRSVAKYQPDRKEGSVGRPFPGVAARVVSVDQGHELMAGQEGMLMVQGPNLMRGYLGRPDLTNQCILEGWYKTGDIAYIDDEGFIFITGRESRFSKVGGEMIPHIQVEEALVKLLGDGEEDDTIRVAVTAVPDEKKGERLVVLHTATDKTPEELRRGLIAAGLPNLFIPAAECFVEVDAIPVLGSGKLDLKRMREVAEQAIRARL